MSDDSLEPLGFNLDIGKILKDVTDPPKRQSTEGSH